MVYFICAFRAEARALIDHYKLQKDSTQLYPVFFNEKMTILISGMGQSNATKAVDFLLSHYPQSNNTILINLGICAAQEKFPIGSLLQVQSLQNESERFELTTFDSILDKVSCFSSDHAQAQATKTDIAEMEAISLYKAASVSFGSTKISILKIVSDHFKPFKIKKQFIIDLIRPHLQEIDAHIKQIQGEADGR
jgi:hypothetical protein